MGNTGNSLSLKVKWHQREINKLNGAVIHNMPVCLTNDYHSTRIRLTPSATRRTAYGAQRLVQARSAWAVIARHVPSRHFRDARVYGHAISAMHAIEYSAPTPLVLAPGRQLHSIPIATSGYGPTSDNTNSLKLPSAGKSASQSHRSRMQLTRYATIISRTPHGSSLLVQAMPAW